MSVLKGDAGAQSCVANSGRETRTSSEEPEEARPWRSEVAATSGPRWLCVKNPTDAFPVKNLAWANEKVVGQAGIVV